MIDILPRLKSWVFSLILCKEPAARGRDIRKPPFERGLMSRVVDQPSMLVVMTLTVGVVVPVAIPEWSVTCQASLDRGG